MACGGGAHRLGLPASTVRHLLRRFRNPDGPGVAPRYAACGPHPAGPPAPLRADHQVVVAVTRLNRAAADAVVYAQALGGAVTAVHVATDGEVADRLRADWQRWGTTVPLVVLPSPYRDVIGPLVKFVHHRGAGREGHCVTVVLPEVVARHWWQETLHNQVALALQFALRGHPGVVVTTVSVRI